jgi:competence protein ComEC
VLETFEVAALASSLSLDHPLNALVPSPRRCLSGERWEWDGVRFAFLHPAPDTLAARRNNLSCVLRVASSAGAVLLTGDIERAAENELALAQSIKSEVLLVPHHGSRTSSSPEFLAAVAPLWAIVPVGYRSRFGHPSAEVMERYRSAGVQMFRTDRDGAVTVALGSAIDIKTERHLRGRYWLQ